MAGAGRPTSLLAVAISSARIIFVALPCHLSARLLSYAILRSSALPRPSIPKAIWTRLRIQPSAFYPGHRGNKCANTQHLFCCTTLQGAQSRDGTQHGMRRHALLGDSYLHLPVAKRRASKNHPIWYGHVDSFPLLQSGLGAPMGLPPAQQRCPSMAGIGENRVSLAEYSLVMVADYKTLGLERVLSR
jgi:hypothetical protein